MSLNLKTLKSAIFITLISVLVSCQSSNQPVEQNAELKNILEQLQRKGAWNEAIELANVQLTSNLKEEDRINYLIVIGDCNRMKEAYAESEEVFRQVIAYDPLKYPQVGKAYYGMGDLNYLKWAYFMQEDKLDTAIKYVNKAKEVAESSNNYPLLSQSLYRLGTIDQIQENNEIAMEKFNEANRLAYTVSDTAGIIRNSTHKAVGFQRAGNLDSAAYYYRHSLQLASTSNNYYSEAHALGNLGEFYQDQEQLDSALKYYNRALFLSEKLDHSLILCKSTLLLGLYYSETGNYREAIKYLAIGKTIAERAGYKNFISYFESTIGEVETKEQQ